MYTPSVDRFREHHLNDTTRAVYGCLRVELGEEVAKKVLLRLIQDLSSLSIHIKSCDAVLRAQRLELAGEMLVDGYSERDVARKTRLPLHTVQRLARGDFGD